MTPATKLYIVGSGGHAGVIIDAAIKSRMVLAGLMDEVNPVGEIKHGHKIEARPSMETQYQVWYDFFIAVGDNAIRERLSAMRCRFINISHPTAQHGVMDCKGSFFGANSVVGNNSLVGSFSIINTGVILEHDSTLGDFSHLCPGVVTGGRVKIGSRTTIGLGAMIRDGVTIGENCIIGMGSNVLCDIPDNSVAWGNPCKIQP